MAYSGKFRPKNLEKYKGDANKVTYRSSWEAWLMKWCDQSPMVSAWNSEEVIIPYFSNADGKKRRYFMDFYVKMTTGDVFLFEVKPDKETRPPVMKSTNTAKAKRTFVNEMYTWQVNTDKWKAAQALCASKGWHFKIITETTLRSHFGWKG
ncbi:head closure [Aeromonas phage GomatiRiver_11]|nr:hypothetical protein OBDJBBDK_00217 [Aeromonas phage AhFM11]WKW84387.1 head closure [Aeromonas phage GomatiRiver_11]